MPVHITTPYPNPVANATTEQKVAELQNLLRSLIDNAEWALCHLDAGNVIEAQTVKAENIDTKNAKITNAQIKNVNADKITAGTIDLSKNISVKGADGAVLIDDSGILLKDENGNDRVWMGQGAYDGFGMLLLNAEGKPTIAIDDKGNAVFTGTVVASKVESSEIYATKIVGIDKTTYEELGIEEEKNTTNKVFTVLTPHGLKIYHNSTSKGCLQKVGLTVNSSGYARIIIGSGTGAEQDTINGVTYGEGCFVIEENRYSVEMGFYGDSPIGDARITFDKSDGTVRLWGKVEIGNTTLEQYIKEVATHNHGIPDGAFLVATASSQESYEFEEFNVDSNRE